MICSELCWLTSNPSQESRCFWEKEYSGIDTIEHKLAEIQSEGYLVRGHFIYPDSDWTLNYDNPMQINLETMKMRYPDNKIALGVAD